MGPGRILAVVVVAAMVVGSIAAARFVAVKHERDHDRDERADVQRVAVALDGVTSIALAQLRSAAAFMRLRPHLDQEDFERLIEDMVAEDSVAAVSYLEALPPGSKEEADLSVGRAGYAVRLRSTGAVGGRLSPASEAVAEHLASVLGRARRSGAPAVSDAVRLGSDGALHLVFFHPVRDNMARTADFRQARGMVAGVVPISALITVAADLIENGGRFALIGPDGGMVGGTDRVQEDYSAVSLMVGDRVWELRLVLPDDQVWALPLLVGLSGLVLAATIGLLLLNWSRRERNVLELARIRLEQRDRAMKAEAEMNRMYRVLAENLTDIVIVIDPEWNITYISPAAQRMLGWSTEKTVGRSAFELLHPDDREAARANLESLRGEPSIRTFEHRFRHVDGHYVWVESAVRSVFDESTGEFLELHATTRDISERKPLQEQLERLAHEDALTGLGNRRRFNEQLNTELARSRRTDRPCAVLLIDVDNFKRVNDSYGHLTGDRVLRRVADALQSRMRASDAIARLGGDEFAAILPETDLERAQRAAGQIVEAVRGELSEDPDLPDVTVSVGVATFEGESDVTSEHLLERADLALYEAKAAGRDRLDVYGHQAGAY